MQNRQKKIKLAFDKASCYALHLLHFRNAWNLFPCRVITLNLQDYNFKKLLQSACWLAIKTSVFFLKIYSFSRETINCGTLQFWLVAILFEATKLTSFITGKYNKTSTKETSFVKTSHQTVSSNNCPWLVNKKWLGLTRYHNAVVSKNSE